MAAVTDTSRPDLGGNLRHGDIHTFCPNLWRYLVDRYGVRSVLDVGCGEGHAVLYFHRMGIFAHGIDGLSANVQRAVAPIARHDILSAPYLMPVDLVWSCEVAEHIAEEFVENFIDTLCNGKVVAMTHAVPGQGGYHHVNCQPATYWVDRMRNHGFSLSDEADFLREIARKEMVSNYFAKTGLVFVRN